MQLESDNNRYEISHSYNAKSMVGPFGSEVAGDVISGRNVKTIEGYVVVNFEVTSSSNFLVQDIQT